MKFSNFKICATGGARGNYTTVRFLCNFKMIITAMGGWRKSMHKLQNTAGRQKLIFIVIQIIWQLPRLHRHRHLMKLDSALSRRRARR